MGRRYRRRNNGLGSIVSDTAYIGSRLSWWGTLLLGITLFFILYILVPLWLESKSAQTSGSVMSPIFDVVYNKHIQKFEWAGIACFLIGFFLGLRNYLLLTQVDYKERGFIRTIAKIIANLVN